MDAPFLELVVYARADVDTAADARGLEDRSIAQKLRRTSAEVASGTRLIVEDTRLQLLADRVPVTHAAPPGIDLLENDYRVALYTGAPEFAGDGAALLDWAQTSDLATGGGPQLLAALRNNASGEDATLLIQAVELHEGSLMLIGKVAGKGLTAALLAAFLGSYGQPIALDHWERLKSRRETSMVEKSLRADPLVSGGRCTVRAGYVLSYELLISHATRAYDYQHAETSEVATLRICNLQVALHALGYPVSRIDGVMGSNTREAWRRFLAAEGAGRTEPVGESYARLLHKVVEDKADRVRALEYERRTS